MNLADTRKRILEDDAFVMSEVEKLRYVYRLKKEIRWAQKRTEVLDTESVAEHIFGMHVLANYFLPLEDIKEEWDKLKILETITWHDLDEVETGDTITQWKTATHEREAELAWPKAIGNLPKIISQPVAALIEAYEAKTTPEARFIKAIDKSEPVFMLLDESYNAIMHRNGTTLAKHWEGRGQIIYDYPYLLRFVEVIVDEVERRGYFAPENKN